jgi:hypothetical protein
VAVRRIGGPTLVIEVGGLRLVTDPAGTAAGIGPVDVVLLSRDRLDDGLGTSGHDLLARVPLVLTTAGCAERLGGAARALQPWYHLSLPRPDGGELRITGVPARRGPDRAEHLPGEVTGFVLSGVDIPTIYLGDGDDVVQDAERRCPPPDIAVRPAAGEIATF